MRAILVLAVGSGLLVACNDGSSFPEPPAPHPIRAIEPDPAPVHKPEPVARTIDLSLGEGFEMRRPIVDGKLTVIPIVTTKDPSTLPTRSNAQRFITLHDGMARDLVSVREIGGADNWDVDWVRVTNRSRETLVILEGELILDGMQDRITAEATTILAGETRRVQVKCVEEDRDYGGTRFNAGHAIAELSLRRTLVHGNQDAIWAKVKSINAREKLFPRTNTYRHAAKAQLAGDGADRRQRILRALGDMEERPKLVGFAIAVDDQVMAIERFADPALYRAYEATLLASYMPTTSGERIAVEKKLSPDDVRELATQRKAARTDVSFTVIRAL